jgi:hypothetical protein
LFFNVNGAARDTDNNKLHNEKTPQPTKGQRYDRLTEENISNIMLSVSRAAPLTLKNKLVNDSSHFHV